MMKIHAFFLCLWAVLVQSIPIPNGQVYFINQLFELSLDRKGRSWMVGTVCLLCFSVFLFSGEDAIEVGRVCLIAQITTNF